MSTTILSPTDRHETATAVRARPAVATTEVPRSARGLLFCFTLTIFLSATLLFLVQPMIGKMILPMLGGTPAVWNTCMVFFQAMLLAGYAYAHATTSRLGFKPQAAIHVVVLLLPLLVLPITTGRSNPPDATASPVFWLLTCLVVAIGLPFFVVSTSGPLLQKWFAQTGHPSAGDPFFLYAASNAGSMAALLGYPLLVEPSLTVANQSRVWTIGYGGLIVMIAVCAAMVWRSRDKNRSGRTSASPLDAPNRSTGVEASAGVTVRRRLWWVSAAFVPSSLMLGVTTHITSNLAPVPLLWVLPLAIYLLTFVLVFARRRPVPHTLMVRLLPFLLPPLAALTFLELPGLGWVAIPVHLLVFFVAAMVCHGELANRRPTAAHLTEFYLWMSVGGVLGGLFNAILAPLLFHTVAEYPLAMVLACLLLPGRHRAAGMPRRNLLIARRPTQARRSRRPAARTLDLVLPLGLFALAAGLIGAIRLGGWHDSPGLRGIVFVPLALMGFSFKDRPIRFALGLAVFVMTLANYVGLHRGGSLYVGRNFFGVKRVTVDRNGVFRVLIHGNTTHGKQYIDSARQGEPLAYYHRAGPLGDVFSALAGPRSKRRIAVVGLGAGSIAAYLEPDQAVTFYEIDPEVERIARNPEYFTFLARCRGAVDVVLGDGRLTLAEAPNHRYGVIVLDAFASDAIPTHLLTREAIQLYLDKLEADGLLVFHISNRYLDLGPLLGRLAADAGLVARIKRDLKITPEEKANGKAPSIYVVIARDRKHLGSLASHAQWKPLPAGAGAPVWTDQYTSLLPLLRWGE